MALRPRGHDVRPAGRLAGAPAQIQGAAARLGRSCSPSWSWRHGTRPRPQPAPGTGGVDWLASHLKHIARRMGTATAPGQESSIARGFGGNTGRHPPVCHIIFEKLLEIVSQFRQTWQHDRDMVDLRPRSTQRIQAVIRLIAPHSCRAPRKSPCGSTSPCVLARPFNRAADALQLLLRLLLGAAHVDDFNASTTPGCLDYGPRSSRPRPATCCRACRFSCRSKASLWRPQPAE